MKGLNQEHFEELYLLAVKLLEQGQQADALEKHLLQCSDDIVLINVAIKEAKNSHYSRLRKDGFRLVVIGCITGLSGFLITFINFNTSRSIDLAMYGLTSLGITIVFWGLFKIIG